MAVQRTDGGVFVLSNRHSVLWATLDGQLMSLRKKRSVSGPFSPVCCVHLSRLSDG